LDKSGKSVGILRILLRREVKLKGTLKIELKEAELSFESPDKIKPVKCAFKLGTKTTDTPAADPKAKGNSAQYLWKGTNIEFEVNDENNFCDLFIELWDSGTDKLAKEKTPHGYSRLTIYDTRKKFSSALTVENPKDMKSIGTLKLVSQFVPK